MWAFNVGNGLEILAPLLCSEKELAQVRKPCSTSWSFLSHSHFIICESSVRPACLDLCLCLVPYRDSTADGDSQAPTSSSAISGAWGLQSILWHPDGSPSAGLGSTPPSPSFQLCFFSQSLRHTSGATSTISRGRRRHC